MTNANALPIQDRLRGAAVVLQAIANEQASFDPTPAVKLEETKPLNLPLEEAADRIDALEKALREIADGRGHCDKCGTLAEGEGAGVIMCDCHHASWMPPDAKHIARAALGEGE